MASIADVDEGRRKERVQSAHEEEFADLFEKESYLNDNIPLDELGMHLRRTKTNREKGSLPE
ncbi:hypothetical protein [Halobacillus litoralis]|uniref:hypothetical protein n=1 Tax=Halobacillus litoralis TaxID=45668 RepID=UPI001CFC5D86|nr:hypothetical protein [Halobacillus litoralis]